MKISDIIELLLLATLWGGSFLFMRIAAPVLGPVWLIEMRVLLAGLTLLPFLIRLNLWNEVRQKLVPLFIVGCINSALPFLLLAFASVFLPAGFTSILNAAAPLFGTLIAGLWLKEKLTLGQFMGLAIGFAGVTILVGWTAIPATSEFIWAVAAGLSGAFLYAVAAPYARRKLAGVNAIAVATGSQLGAALFLLPIAPWFIPNSFPSMRIIAVVVGLGLFSTALAYVIYFHLISSIGASKTLIVTYLIPLFAMFWGALILNEPITSSMILGCALILFGTAIALSQSTVNG